MVPQDDQMMAVLQRIAPGTALREGVDRIILARKGAIIVLGAGEAVQSVISGGFKMETKFTAQRLSELAKMDGAIILDDDAERILRANVHLVPDASIPTSETGTRHRTSERTAKHTNAPVVCVSEAMRTVNLYVGDRKHTLEDVRSVLFRANQALATLERYRKRLAEVSATLSALEIENMVTLRDVLTVVQRVEMVRHIAQEIDTAIAELGTDGRLVQLQLDELMAGVENERVLVVRDYLPPRRRKLDVVLRDLASVPAEALLDSARLADVLGYGPDADLDQGLAPRGYRLLSRIPRLPQRSIDALVTRFQTLPKLMIATLSDLDAVEGIGTARARAIKEGLTRLVETSTLDRYS